MELKVLEEKVAMYMSSAIAYEDEQRKNGVLKMQMESLNLLSNELNAKLADEIRRAENVGFCTQ